MQTQLSLIVTATSQLSVKVDKWTWSCSTSWPLWLSMMQKQISGQLVLKCAIILQSKQKWIQACCFCYYDHPNGITWSWLWSLGDALFCQPFKNSLITRASALTLSSIAVLWTVCNYNLTPQFASVLLSLKKRHFDCQSCSLPCTSCTNHSSFCNHDHSLSFSLATVIWEPKSLCTQPYVHRWPVSLSPTAKYTFATLTHVPLSNTKCPSYSFMLFMPLTMLNWLIKRA